MQLIKKIIYFILNVPFWLLRKLLIILTNLEYIIWHGMGFAFLGMGIYVIGSLAFEAVDHTVITPTKNVLYGKPIEKSEAPPWEYGHVLTAQENHDLIYILNSAMQILSKHKPIGK